MSSAPIAEVDRILSWPDGSIYRITRSSTETGGSELVMDLELPAGGWAPQAHVHPHITEEYHVLEGSFEVLIGKEWRTLREGESARVPPGAVHTFRVGAAPVRIRNSHRPPLDFEPYLRKLCKTANQRGLGDLSGLRSLVYIAMLVNEFPRHSRAPGRLLNAAVRPIAGVARLIGLETA
jgi:mannose-6-phosphate isomerase-like protein (cupin superfamily)